MGGWVGCRLPRRGKRWRAGPAPAPAPAASSSQSGDPHAPHRSGAGGSSSSLIRVWWPSSWRPAFALLLACQPRQDVVTKHSTGRTSARKRPENGGKCKVSLISLTLQATATPGGGPRCQVPQEPPVRVERMRIYLPPARGLHQTSPRDEGGERSIIGVAAFTVAR
ncbi:hypothetical protein ANO11243_075290 [Dothideomycetidae sp. 11243]|nr:hypothetical protein ANO11243_075290 [fungal sp. No.11243]